MHLRTVAFAAGATAALLFALFSLLAHRASALAPCFVPDAAHPTIQDAVADAQCQEIQLTAPAYVANVVISRSLSISGAGAAATIVDGGHAGTVFTVASGLAVTLTGFTISGGYANMGSGIFNHASRLLISDTIIAANMVAPFGTGGGIYNQAAGQLAIHNSTLQGNDGGAAGGAIYNAGTLRLAASTVFSNTAQEAAGLRLAPGSSATISNTVFDSNHTTASYGRGGAIFASAPLTLTASTFAGNGAAGGRGGALFVAAAPLYAAGNLLFANQAADGGALYASDAFLALDDNIFNNNRASGSGGAIAAGDSTLTFTRGRLEQNEAAWGGAFSLTRGAHAIYTTTLAANSATSSGGAIATTGALTVTASAVSDNQAVQSGGAIWSAAPLLLRNSTISGNKAISGAGLLTFAAATLSSSTVANNLGSAGGGIGGSGNIFTLHNSIIAGNSGGDCLRVSGAATVSLGYNIDGDGTCLLFAPGDQRRVDPFLGPLAANGGPTLTHALPAFSAAVDAGDNTACPARDQRGVIRPQDGKGSGASCDCGAFEYSGPPPFIARFPIMPAP